MNVISRCARHFSSLWIRVTVAPSVFVATFFFIDDTIEVGIGFDVFPIYPVGLTEFCVLHSIFHIIDNIPVIISYRIQLPFLNIIPKKNKIENELKDLKIAKST